MSAKTEKNGLSKGSKSKNSYTSHIISKALSKNSRWPDNVSIS